MVQVNPSDMRQSKPLSCLAMLLENDLNQKDDLWNKMESFMSGVLKWSQKAIQELGLMYVLPSGTMNLRTGPTPQAVQGLCKTTDNLSQ